MKRMKTQKGNVFLNKSAKHDKGDAMKKEDCLVKLKRALIEKETRKEKGEERKGRGSEAENI